jgi:hypothetical protein
MESRYSLDFIADRYVSLYRDMLADGSQAARPHLDLKPTGEERS